MTRTKAGYFRFVLLIGTFAVVLSLPVDIGAQELSKEEAELYRGIADSLVARVLDDSVSTPGSPELIGRARRIDPENGDAHFLAATFIADTQERQVEREALLRSALEGRLHRVSREDVVGELADALMLQRRYRETADLFHREDRNGSVSLPLEYDVLPVVGEDTGQTAPASPTVLDDLSLKYLQARILSGPYWYSTAYLQRLRSRFPLDDDLARLDFLREERISLAFLEWIDYRIASAMDIPEEILLYGIRYGTSQQLRRELAQIYIADGGSDPLAHMALSREFPFQQDDWKADKIVWETTRNWFDQEFYRELTLPEGEIVLEVDTDRDSFWEERYHFTGQKVYLWEEDADQNGVVDRRIQMDRESFRVDATVRMSSEEIIEYRYAPYPLVSEVLQVTLDPDDRNVFQVIRWIPAHPPVHPLGLDEILSDRWDGRHERISLDTDEFRRFDRQLNSDDARFLTSSEMERYVELLQERGIIY